ncbi:MAG: response regulator transcription factor [Gammaproteobacteria bacterium]|nr:response regulator transcription factor [Gammaproteobacteria bacterium]
MKLVVFTHSSSFESHLGHLLDIECDFSKRLKSPSHNPGDLYLLHISSYRNTAFEWLKNFTLAQPIKIAVCSDRPDLQEMLECVQSGAKAYCNSHMAKVHYDQMFQLLAQGQSWFPPAMLEETFKLAHQSALSTTESSVISVLTRREKEIAKAVEEGMSNRQIAQQFDISEPTVKSHLTNIFKKLDIKDRVSLVLLQQ